MTGLRDFFRRSGLLGLGAAVVALALSSPARTEASHAAARRDLKATAGAVGRPARIYGHGALSGRAGR